MSILYCRSKIYLKEVQIKMTEAKIKVIVDELAEGELKSKMPKYNEPSKGLKMEKLTLMDLPGVGAATAEKLESAGYHDLMSLAVSSVGELIEVTGVSEAVARKMINAARDSMKMGFETGMDVLRRRGLVTKLSTGSADRKSTRLNSSHSSISYAVFCLKK